ncbi:hypothetical protein L6164_015560 [Bauhinia variegata]|uniref:Uncharacterized protein n=1 Tax=Bauhinia variegata TaxID=167791 RepID=A0ACB9NKV4_BAUVA|nr:hypothetical protein L6164_015560 [Bauhinia variegata]
MIGVTESKRFVPNLQISPWEWDPSETSVPPGGTPSPFSVNYNSNASAGDYSPPSSALHGFLSNDLTPVEFELDEEFDMPIDAFSSDNFRMFEFKVRKCARGRSHDWTECPYAHPGEKARRRDPRKFNYSGTACPEFRKGDCSKGDSCEFSHGVFETWLHPARYRTQLCKDGTNCRRRVCFFAHTPEQLRVLTHGSSEPSDGSPIRHAVGSPRWTNAAAFVSSPTSVLDSSPLSDSAPTTPANCRKYGGASFDAVSEIVTAMRNVQLDNTNTPASARSRHCGPVFGQTIRPGRFSLTSSPTKTKSGLDIWDQSSKEEPPMERVQSGRDIRARMYAKLSKENSLGGTTRGFQPLILDGSPNW